MRHLQRLTAISLLAVLAGPSPIVAQQGTPAPTYPREIGYIAMSDGVRLAYTVYLPASTGKFPALLQYEPYVGAGSGPSNRWLQNGYAVVFVNVRGSGCSQGVHDLFGPREGPDGAAVVAWIGRQPWSDQKVGMIGGSYPGHTQILVAAQQPPLLKAIAPSALTASLYDDALYPGGIYNVSFTSRWARLHQPGAEAVGVRARVAWGDRECETNLAAHPPSTLQSIVQAHPTFDRWWQQRSLITHVDRVQVPTFVSGSWQDHQTGVSGGIEVYQRLTAPKRLALAPGGHGAAYAQVGFQNDVVRWMDHWLKGAENGIEREPPVAVYWETRAGPGGGTSWTTNHSAWPPSEATTRTYHLTGSGTLSPAAVADSTTRSYTFPVGVQLIGNNAQFALPPDPTGSLAWTSDPLDADVTIVGAIDAFLYLSSERVDTDLVFDVLDVYPNGDVQFLQRGIMRASFRQVDASRSRPNHLWRAYARKEPLVPGRVYELHLTLPSLGAVLRAGHRLQVALLAPSTVAQPDWGLLAVDLPGRNTVYSSSRYPSRIVVPVIPEARAQGPEPACGSMAYQPCRPAPRR